MFKKPPVVARSSPLGRRSFLLRMLLLSPPVKIINHDYDHQENHHMRVVMLLPPEIMNFHDENGK